MESGAALVVSSWNPSVFLNEEKSYAPMIFPTNISRKISFFFFFLAPFCLAREERRKESSVHDASQEGRAVGTTATTLRSYKAYDTRESTYLAAHRAPTNWVSPVCSESESGPSFEFDFEEVCHTDHKERRAAPKRKAGWSGYGRGGGEVEAEERRVRSRVKTLPLPSHPA